MLDWILVDTPIAFPNRCACGNQKGPLVDTHMEPGGLRLYVCQRCAKQSARLFGFADGERMEELSHVNESLTGLQRELRISRIENAELTGKLIDESKRAEAALQTNVDLKHENERLKMELDGIAQTAKSLSAIA